MPQHSSATHTSGRLSSDDVLIVVDEEQAASTAVACLPRKAIPMDTFKWIISGLLAALVLAVGWFLDGIHAEFRRRDPR